MGAEPPATQAPRLNIIGCGRAAGSLARLWLQAGAVRLGEVLNRSPASARTAVSALGAGTPVARLGDMRAADCWMLGTGDDQIADAALALRDARVEVDGALVFHLAGRHGLEVLAPLLKRCALTAALHPVRSLTHDLLTLEDFRGTACVAEGPESALALLRPLVTAIGGLWLPVHGIDRGLYHAAVSIVSNVTKAVTWKAQTWLEHAGLPAATAAAVTHQLLHSTLADLFRSGARQSITGPVVRGDTRTIEAHLAALRESHPGDVAVYQVLARTVLDLARKRGDLDEATLARFEVLLGG